MDNRSKFWRGVMVGVLVTAFACLVTVGTSAGIYMFGRRVIDNQVQVQAEQGNSGAEASADGQAGNQTLDMERVNRKLTELQTIIDKKYLFEDKVEVEKEESGIYNGFLFGLNDPYAVYYRRRNWPALWMRQTVPTAVSERWFHRTGRQASPRLSVYLKAALPRKPESVREI